MFRQAYVRGVNQALINTGAVKYASDEVASEVADAVAEQLPEQPVDEVAPEATSEIAGALVDLSQKLEEAAANASSAAETVAATEGGTEVTASLKNAALRLRRKLAEGTTVDPSNPAQFNTAANAASTGPTETKDEIAARGPDYANVGVGNIDHPAGGEVGSTSDVSQGNAVRVDGTNSVNKTSALRRLIRKLAEGTTVDPSNPAQFNTAANAAATGPTETKDEVAARGPDYANVGVGNIDHPAGGEVGSTSDVSQGNAVRVDGTNSVNKSAADKKWLAEFKAVGAKYAGSLPFYLNEGEKVAAIQYMMSLSPSERESVAMYMSKTAEMPEGLKDYVEAKKEDSSESSSESSEPKKCENCDDPECKGECEGEGGKCRGKKASVNTGDIISTLRKLSRK